MSTDDVVPFREATRAWWAISWQTFGGPAGQIAVMHRALVEEKKWIGPDRFLFALSYCTLLPGPEAQQLATYVGWLLNGTRGAIVAGVLFVLPGMLSLLALAALVVAVGDTGPVSALFAGLSAAVMAVVAHALVQVARRTLRTWLHRALAIGAFVALTFFAVPFPLILGTAALAGLLALRNPPAQSGQALEQEALLGDHVHAEAPSWRRSLRVMGVCALLWVVPMGVVAWWVGQDTVIVQQGLFYSGTALVTFGGAYAVLAWVAQQVVGVHGWVSAGDMSQGLALAESTPGPLIMVVQFVAFIGAYRHPGGLDPWLAAVVAALLTTWVTFLPSFLFVLLGAPWVERLRNNRRLAAALAGVSAAVVGMMAHLAWWFAVHTLFDDTREATAGPIEMVLPVWSEIDLTTLVIAVVAAVLLFGVRLSVLRTLGVCAALALAWHLVT